MQQATASKGLPVIVYDYTLCVFFTCNNYVYTYTYIYMFFSQTGSLPLEPGLP